MMNLCLLEAPLFHTFVLSVMSLYFHFKMLMTMTLLKVLVMIKKINELNMKSAAAFVGDGIDSEYITASKFKGKYSQSDNLL